MYHKIIICSNCENVTHRVLRICTINHHCSAPTFTYFVIDIVFKEFRMFKSLKLFYRKENICQNLQRLPSFVLKCLSHYIPMQRILESCYSGSCDTVTLLSVSFKKFEKKDFTNLIFQKKFFSYRKLHIFGIFHSFSIPQTTHHLMWG